MKFLIRLLILVILTLLTLSLLAGYIPPSFSVIFALAGLGFPILWIIVFILVPFLFLINERWLAMICITILLLSSATFLHYFNLSLNRGNKDYQYSIYDFNTYGLRYPDTVSDQIINQKKFHDILNSDSHTIICFQEYPMKGSKHGKFYQQLDQGLSLPYKSLSSYYWNQKYTEYILVTASQYLILDEKVFTYDSLNFAMYSDIRLPEATVRIYNVHFQSVKLTTERKLLMINRHVNLRAIRIQLTDAIRKLKIAFIHRENQALILQESIKSSPYPVIIAGDFNDTPASFVYKTLKRGLKDASSSSGNGFGRTFKFSRFPLQIDYLLHSSSISSSGYRFINNNLSDHYAISCKFKIEKE